ncbi:GNAT family N-acetyltransferase [Microlunatus parietis]|uniref:GNAT superfamily N-acetyltransferase n=1 Tax=Microlunatus parietis TaxID=682979 RepID=A0A7Y9I8R4_9ACTN|nr:GNAT family N-acetyltransferase [Microlunatus parietis]NYE72282.1 GNAT superfamily N-acetyltransferase [Microlunatus parietis]
MAIRVGRADDAEALQQVGFSGTPVDVVRGWLDPPQGPDRVLLVATDQNDVAIGTCTLTRRRHRMERHRAEIGGFVIRADHRGTGVARKLVEGCAAFARELWSSQTLELGVRGGTHAEDAYRGLGFTEWARFPGGLRDRDATYDDVRMFLPVGDDPSATVVIPPHPEH